MFHLGAGTVLARLAVFPVIVKGQREAAKLNNVLPEMTKLTTRMNEAKQSGNKFECKYLTFYTSFIVGVDGPDCLLMLCCLALQLPKPTLTLTCSRRRKT